MKLNTGNFSKAEPKQSPSG
uniref:Uncharacterized protein n=1 Tax=Anguilla anguilla TaxID=7936 RepID=A0A0E9UBQ1_ANGAN